MAKRFIDTGMFDDEWFMSLSKDGKLLYLYIITKCSHAGLIELNERLCKFQTGIGDIKTAIQDLGNRLIRLKEGFFFAPKFLFFQYPNFPNSKVFQQKTALDDLTKLGLFKNGKLTLEEGFFNPYDNDSDNDSEYVKGESEGEIETISHSEFIELFNSITERNYKGTSKDKAQFSSRVKDGYTLEDFKKAIKNCLSDPYHKENPQHLTPEFITRPDKLEKFLNYKTSTPQKSSVSYHQPLIPRET